MLSLFLDILPLERGQGHESIGEEHWLRLVHLTATKKQFEVIAVP